MTVDLVALSSVLGGFAGAAVVIGGAVKFIVCPLRKLIRQQEEFREDWYGELARPGRPAVPGVPERIRAIEAEFQPDHGGSMRDAVNRLELGLTEHISHHQNP